MNLPTQIEKQAFSKLPDGLKPFAEARIEPPVKSINDLKLKNECLNIITISYSEQAQFNVESSILTHQTKALYDELRSHSKFRELTLTEVKNAFKVGIRGESGPFFGMCAKTYHQFLKHYYDKPERVKAMNEYLKLINVTNKEELSPEEKLKKSKEACLWFFKEYKETKILPNGHYSLYDTLWSFGLLRMPPEQKKAVKTKITQEYVKAIESAKKRGRISSVQLKDILGNLDSNPTLKGMLRKEAIIIYFNELITNNKSLENEINEKLNRLSN